MNNFLTLSVLLAAVAMSVAHDLVQGKLSNDYQLVYNSVHESDTVEKLYNGETVVVPCREANQRVALIRIEDLKPDKSGHIFIEHGVGENPAVIAIPQPIDGHYSFEIKVSCYKD